MNLPKLIFEKDYDILKKGILQTTCVCCGEDTDTGLNFSFSDLMWRFKNAKNMD